MKSLKRTEMGEEAWAEYQRTRKNDKAERHRLKNGLHAINWRRRAKLKLIEYKGGKCEICGYCKPCPRAYHFHHMDPSKKDFAISAYGQTRSFERLKTEVDKCKLLCSNCHAEIHDEECVQSRMDGLAKYQDRLDSLVAKKVVQCPCCKTEFLQRHGNQIYCSGECSRTDKRKTTWPSREELQRLIEDGASWLKLGERYGVSDHAVKKWAIKYGILIPERRSDRISERPCLRCRTLYKPVYNEQKYCCDDCAKLARRIKRPSKERMAEMLQQMSYDEVGKQYGVKREAARRWAMQYGLSHLRQRFGRVAHSEERFRDMEEVVGAEPIAPTKQECVPSSIGRASDS